MTMRIATSPVVWVGAIVGVLIAAAEYASGSEIGPSILGGSIPVAYGVAVTLLGRRSAISSALAGRPVDERWEHVNLEAAAVALGVSALAILGGFILALASSGDWQPYALMGAVMAVSYIVALVVVEARH